MYKTNRAPAIKNPYDAPEDLKDRKGQAVEME
jgi:hypothetical protein